MKSCVQQSCGKIGVKMENCQNFCDNCGFRLEKKKEQMINSCKQEDCCKFNIQGRENDKYCSSCGSYFGKDEPEKVTVKTVTLRTLKMVKTEIEKGELDYKNGGNHQASYALSEFRGGLEDKIEKIEETSSSPFSLEHMYVQS